ncbi:MAG: carbon starvation protein A [Opitutales bacterium]|nr:carbon starvation protein A [Opitutales bacterium]
MQTLVIALSSLILFLVAYHTYGKWLARKIFKLDPNALVPSKELEDGTDYVPSAKEVVFGHHFTSIAGTGPIVGPALAVIWGWVPALLWILFGSILIGAVHDFGALVISLRNKGQTIGDVAGRIITPRVRFLFLSVLFLALTIVLAIFGLVIAAVFRSYPSAIFPCLVQIPLAIVIGVFLHRKGVNLLIPSIIALALMYLSVAFGDVGFLGDFNATLKDWDTIEWVLVLLAYSYVASVLPVWTLLQPRDFINSLQLLSTLALVLGGLIVASMFGGSPVEAQGDRPPLEIIAPAFRLSVEGAPWIFPFLFVTIACGAISGFHCLVSSGTSSKQLKTETDAQAIGFGAMLTEGFLATLVLLACAAGIGLGVHTVVGDLNSPIVTGEDAYFSRYETWHSAQGLAAKVGAFVDGSANLLKAVGVPASFAVALMGVFVASFAATTLDSACRLQRYVTQELAGALKIKPLTNKHAATLFAIALAALMAALPLPGKEWSWGTAGTGGLILWPVFGATNQLLGGLAFIVILVWLRRRKLPLFFVIFPTLFMLILPGSAMLIQLLQPGGWFSAGQWPLVAVATAAIVLEAWMIVEALFIWKKCEGQLEPQA